MNSDLNLLLLRARYVPSTFGDFCDVLRTEADVVVHDLVEDIKQVIDQHWSIDPKISLELSNLIIAIGVIREQIGTVALGMMARGDSIRMLGSVREAWDTLRLAGKLYLAAGDEVGWARTRIGRMMLGPSMDRVELVERESRIAHKIFERCGEFERALRLNTSKGYMYQQLGQYQKALSLHEATLRAVEAFGNNKHYHQVHLYTNLGYIYTELGNLRRALEYHQKVYAITLEKQETSAVTLAQVNIAYIFWMQGRYHHALNHLLSVEQLSAATLPIQSAGARRLIVKCYLNLNRYAEARELGYQVVRDCRELNNRYESGYVLMDIAIAEAELGEFEAAIAALDEAEAVFSYSGAQTWVANIQRRRGQIALRQGNLETALIEARTSAAYFEANNEQVNYAWAVLLEAQAALASGNAELARQVARTVLKIALHSRVPWLRYSIHLLLGRIAERQSKIGQAIRRYNAAACTIERVQQELTITLRPGFLENKEDALRALVQLYLETGQAACAFAALERAKSQTVLNHLANRENLQWLRHDKRSQLLIEELEKLRLDHHAYYQLVFDSTPGQVGSSGEIVREEARLKLSRCEARMRAITEQLYLCNENTRSAVIAAPQVDEIQARVGPHDALVAFYHDSHSIWAFTLDQTSIQVQKLPMSRREFDESLRQFRFDIACALKIGAVKGPFSNETRVLTPMTRHWLKTFHDGLIAPLNPHLQNRRRLTLVPYGSLHYLPFHMLHDGEHYLIENHEMVISPSAGLLTRPAVTRPSGAVIFGHSNGGLLPAAVEEAELLARLLNGDLYINHDARRTSLPSEPKQILHIAAHGQYRLDQPELSYIHLEDGQLYTDDLFQQDMSYELVTLSACETGRAKPVPGDELVGIGRGFLYAGAGALITSLWRIDDQLTRQMMMSLYGRLQRGASKAAALRDTQCELLRDYPDLHPAFWGAFQLIGNADPLSSTIR